MDTVTLGNHKNIPVVPQKHAKLRRHLTPEAFQRIMSRDYSTEAYRTLCILIPAMDPASPSNRAAGGGGIPLWEWEGYVSEEAMANDDYDEENDPSPDTAQIVDAFETALLVSGANRLGKIIDLVQSAGSLIQASQTQTPTVPSPDLPGNTGG